MFKANNFYIDYDNIENEQLRELEIEKYKNIFTKEIIENYKQYLKMWIIYSKII